MQRVMGLAFDMAARPFDLTEAPLSLQWSPERSFAEKIDLQKRTRIHAHDKVNDPLFSPRLPIYWERCTLA